MFDICTLCPTHQVMGWRMSSVGFDPIQLLPNFSSLTWGLAPVQIVLICMTLFVATIKFVQWVIGRAKFITNSDGSRSRYVMDARAFWGGTLMVFLCDGLMNCKGVTAKEEIQTADIENPGTSTARSPGVESTQPTVLQPKEKMAKSSGAFTTRLGSRI